MPTRAIEAECRIDTIYDMGTGIANREKLIMRYLPPYVKLVLEDAEAVVRVEDLQSVLKSFEGLGR